MPNTNQMQKQTIDRKYCDKKHEKKQQNERKKCLQWLKHRDMRDWTNNDDSLNEADM